ncbi:unnamed protein product, partial [Hapterophycus canaliculatus]
PPERRRSPRDFLQESPVLRVVDVNIERAAECLRTPVGNRGKGGGSGSSVKKRTPEERAYLVRAGSWDISSNASSIGSCPFAGTSVRLAAASPAAADADENAEPPATTDDAPASPTASVDTASGSPLPPPTTCAPHQPGRCPRPLEDSVSLRSSPRAPEGAPSRAADGAGPAAAMNGARDDRDGAYDDHDRHEDGVWCLQAEGEAREAGMGRGPGGRGEGEGEEFFASEGARDGDRPGCSRGEAGSCSDIGYRGSYDGDAGSFQPVREEARQGSAERRRGSSHLYHQEGGVWIDVDGTPMGK